MKATSLKIEKMPGLLWGKPGEGVYLFLHGKSGSKEEGEAFANIVCSKGWQVLAVDLPEHGARKGEKDAFNPWHVVPELTCLMSYIRERWKRVGLRANSIGAWFAMQSYGEESLENCLLVSPVLDMQGLIERMMGWAGVSPQRLEAEGEIVAAFGETLSWRYYTYAKDNPLDKWDSPTSILCPGRDDLTPGTTTKAFADRFHCDLTIMAEGEHWFHTPEQLEVLADWTNAHTWAL